VSLAYVMMRMVCLAVYNPTLVPGVQVTLVDQPDATQLAESAIVKEATVVERLSQSCDNHIGMVAGNGFSPSFYQIRLVTKPSPFYSTVVAIINPDRPITVRAGKIDADLDGDGTNESFRTCSSSEGVHHQSHRTRPVLVHSYHCALEARTARQL